MPEGDTAWRAARTLDRALTGQMLTATDFRVPALATADLSGATVLETVSRGKHLLTRLDTGWTIHTHLRMEGTWAVHARGTRWRRPAHTARLVLQTDTTEAVGFSVVVRLVKTTHEDELTGHLGPDLLGPDWDPAEAAARLGRAPDTPVADALLDQRNLAGIGNVYKCELCFLLGIAPHTLIGQVDNLRRMVDLAHELLTANRDRPVRVTTGDTRAGRTTWVYGRRGPCLRCGTPIRCDRVGAQGRDRTTWWCPSCQPMPASSPGPTE